MFVGINTNAYVKMSGTRNLSADPTFTTNTTNTVRVCSRNVVGRISEVREITLIVDVNTPTIRVSEPQNGIWTNSGNLVVR